MERLRISDNKRYLVTPDGKPFPWLADTVWTMPQRLKWDDAEYLMKRRKAQGFTALQICPGEIGGHSGINSKTA